MRETQHLVVGAGPGGYVAAIRLAQSGRRVTVIEADALGGTCLNHGCIPSKALIHVAHLFERIQGAAAFGIHVAGARIDLAAVQRFKRQVVERLQGGIALLFQRHGIEWIRGTASLRDVRTARIAPADGGAPFEIRAESILLATGGRPIEIPGFPFDGTRILSSRDALSLEELPGDFVVIGGGVIGLEIGSLYAQMGSRVTVIEMTDQLLPGTDPDLVRVVERELKRRGVTVRLGAKATGLRSKGRAAVVDGTGPDGAFEAAADKVLVAVGVRPASDSLGLAAAGLVATPKGTLAVNERMQTSVPTIFAIGDLVGPPLLAHKASKEGLIAAGAMAGGSDVLDIRAMPAAIFTQPEIATVGITESQAKSQGRAVRVGTFPFAASGRALSTGASDGLVKVIADERTDEILGVGIVGEDASNLISEAALALEMGATAEDLSLTVHPHPTLSEAIQEAAEAVHGRAIHVAPRPVRKGAGAKS